MKNIMSLTFKQTILKYYLLDNTLGYVRRGKYAFDVFLIKSSRTSKFLLPENLKATVTSCSKAIAFIATDTSHLVLATPSIIQLAQRSIIGPITPQDPMIFPTLLYNLRRLVNHSCEGCVL